MKYSFIIPVYNTERYLSRCLDSLFAQTENDFEVIVVDDCSPGNCEEIIHGYGRDIRYMRHETNKSAYQARRTGILAAQGDYIVPVDPDDYLLPDTLAKTSEIIAAEAPDVISYWIDYDDGKKIYPHWCRHPAGTISGADAIRELSQAKYMTGVATKALKRTTVSAAIKDLDFVKNAYLNTSDDYLLLTAVLMRARKMSFLPFPCYRYYVNNQSTTMAWRDGDGFRRACKQTRFVVDAVAELARRRNMTDSVWEDVLVALNGLERFFVSQAMECKAEFLKARLSIVREALHAENVAAEVSQRFCEVVSSRTYRVSCVFSRILSLLRK